MKIWKSRFFGQKFFFSKNFFLTIFRRWFQIFSGKNFFFPDSNSRVLTFLRPFFEKMFFSIFFSILSSEPSNLVRIHYFWCFSRKNDKTRKKISFWHFLVKLDFWSIFVILKIFWDIGNPKFFFHRFLITRVLTNSLIQKNLKKIDFGGMR